MIRLTRRNMARRAVTTLAEYGPDRYASIFADYTGDQMVTVGCILMNEKEFFLLEGDRDTMRAMAVRMIEMCDRYSDIPGRRGDTGL